MYYTHYDMLHSRIFMLSYHYYVNDHVFLDNLMSISYVF